METEKRLIDANVVLAKQFTAGLSDASGNYYGYADVVFADDIENAPTVDAVEVVHGRTGPSYMDEYFGEWKDCLECGTDNIWPSNYCRNCGAKMDGK